jgi:hypothetical protein
MHAPRTCRCYCRHRRAQHEVDLNFQTAKTESTVVCQPRSQLQVIERSIPKMPHF